MAPKQPPTLKKIDIVSSESESESEPESQDEESQPIIETKSKINEQSKCVKQRENIESESEEVIEKVIEPKLDDMTLLINITKKEDKLLKELSDLHKAKMILIKKFEKKKETKGIREAKPHKPLKTISPIIKNFIGCEDDAKYTFNALKKFIKFF